VSGGERAAAGNSRRRGYLYIQDAWIKTELHKDNLSTGLVYFLSAFDGGKVNILNRMDVKECPGRWGNKRDYILIQTIVCATL